MNHHHAHFDDKDLQCVHPPPSKILHPLLGSDRCYHFMMQEKLWQRGSTLWGDSVGIKHIDGRAFQVDVKGEHRLLQRNRMLLQDKAGDVVAVIASKTTSWLLSRRVFKIYGFHPLVNGQNTSKEDNYNSKSLYEWGETTYTNGSIFSRRTITLQTLDGVKYVAEPEGGAFSLSPPRMRITRAGITCVRMVKHRAGIIFGGFSPWEVKICEGIDPTLIICLVAIIDEIDRLNDDEYERLRQL